MIKLATWNVNSLRVRLEHVLTWSAQARPTIFALQETKVADDAFPAGALEDAGWHVLHAGQPAYNGVAVLGAEPLELLAVDVYVVLAPEAVVVVRPYRLAVGAVLHHAVRGAAGQGSQARHQQQ